VYGGPAAQQNYTAAPTLFNHSNGMRQLSFSSRMRPFPPPPSSGPRNTELVELPSVCIIRCSGGLETAETLDNASLAFVSDSRVTTPAVSGRHRQLLKQECEVKRNLQLHSVKRIHLTPVQLQENTCLLFSKTVRRRTRQTFPGIVYIV